MASVTLKPGVTLSLTLPSGSSVELSGTVDDSDPSVAQALARYPQLVEVVPVAPPAPKLTAAQVRAQAAEAAAQVAATAAATAAAAAQAAEVQAAADEAAAETAPASDAQAQSTPTA